MWVDQVAQNSHRHWLSSEAHLFFFWNRIYYGARYKNHTSFTKKWTRGFWSIQNALSPHEHALPKLSWLALNHVAWSQISQHWRLQITTNIMKISIGSIMHEMHEKIWCGSAIKYEIVYSSIIDRYCIMTHSTRKFNII
jgi:hypothetical protein